MLFRSARVHPTENRFSQPSHGTTLIMYLGKSGEYLSPLFILQIKYRLNIDINRLHPIERIKNVKGAVLVICGSVDKYTTLAESKRMFEQAKEPKQFWVVNGAAHVDFSRFDRRFL